MNASLFSSHPNGNTCYLPTEYNVLSEYSTKDIYPYLGRKVHLNQLNFWKKYITYCQITTFLSEEMFLTLKPLSLANVEDCNSMFLLISLVFHQKVECFHREPNPENPPQRQCLWTTKVLCQDSSLKFTVSRILPFEQNNFNPNTTGKPWRLRCGWHSINLVERWKIQSCWYEVSRWLVSNGILGP